MRIKKKSTKGTIPAKGTLVMMDHRNSISATFKIFYNTY